MNQVTKLSEVFERAVDELWDGSLGYSGKEQFCCFAIRRVHEAPAILREKAVAEIMGRLDGCNTAWSWLRRRLGVPSHRLTQRRLQAWRKEWLRQLAAEFREKGQ